MKDKRRILDEGAPVTRADLEPTIEDLRNEYNAAKKENEFIRDLIQLMAKHKRFNGSL